MNGFRRASVTMLAASCVAVRVVSAQPAPAQTMVDVGGHKLNVKMAGTAKPGVPAVIFESGLGSTLSTWGAVPSEIAAATRTVVYDRAGVGGSEPGPAPRSVKQIVVELHALLAKIELPPPYVLVGHSYGGPLIHYFAATYPSEVVGLVYVDPSDFTQTDADLDAIWEKIGVKDGRVALRKTQEQLGASAPAGVKAEMREIDRMELGGFVDLRAAGDPPDMPTVVLVAGQAQQLPPTITFPGGHPERYFEVLREQRLNHFGRLVERSAKGTLVETSKSGHFIHATEPELLTWAIQRVLSSTASHGELDRFVGVYPLALAPNVTITITRDGDRLFGQLTGQPSFALYADSATKFSLKVVDAQIEFETDPAGSVTGLALSQNGQRLRASKAK
jgi:pimeloyl-ACP methyl ester carboxylesterase